MDANSHRYTVRFEPDLYQQIEATAGRLKTSPSEVIRRAVIASLRGEKAVTESDLRHHRISEFSQIALDQIIRREHPDLVDVIVTETNRRMERHHGTR